MTVLAKLRFLQLTGTGEMDGLGRVVGLPWAMTASPLKADRG
jgi:hypothetical protein